MRHPQQELLRQRQALRQQALLVEQQSVTFQILLVLWVVFIVLSLLLGLLET